jgi:hypothetical protein
MNLWAPLSGQKSAFYGPRRFAQQKSDEAAQIRDEAAQTVLFGLPRRFRFALLTAHPDAEGMAQDDGHTPPRADGDPPQSRLDA